MTISGLGFSMKAREVLPEGLCIIIFPFDHIADLILNLEEMDWEPYWFNLGRDGFMEENAKRAGELAQKLGMPKPNYSE